MATPRLLSEVLDDLFARRDEGRIRSYLIDIDDRGAPLVRVIDRDGAERRIPCRLKKRGGPGRRS